MKNNYYIVFKFRYMMHFAIIHCWCVILSCYHSCICEDDVHLYQIIFIIIWCSFFIIWYLFAFIQDWRRLSWAEILYAKKKEHIWVCNSSNKMIVLNISWLLFTQRCQCAITCILYTSAPQRNFRLSVNVFSILHHPSFVILTFHYHTVDFMISMHIKWQDDLQ